MNRREFVMSIVEKTKLTKKDTEALLKTFISVVEDSLKQGDKIVLTGFGTFEKLISDAREGRNPQTGQKIRIPSSATPKFRAGKILKDALN